MSHQPRDGVLFPSARHHPTLHLSQLPLSSHDQPQGVRPPSSTSFSQSALSPPAQTTHPIGISGRQLFQPLSPFFLSSAMNIAASLPSLDTVQPSSLRSSLASSPDSAHRVGNPLWQCSLGCGKQYEKSSSRSIRRHMVSCFRSHWPGAKELSDSEMQELMSAQQESGHLVTGLRRWKMRQSSRSTLELSDGEKWLCPQGCGQVYRVSSTLSIKNHTSRCRRRRSVELKADGNFCSDDSVPSSPALAVTGENKHTEVVRTNESEDKLNHPLSLRTIPAQFDGFEEDIHLDPGMDLSGNTLPRESSSNEGASFHSLPFPGHQPIRDWEDTPLRMLLRRQQLETEHLSARHFMEIVALGEESGIATQSSTLPFGLQPSTLSPN